MSLAKKGKHYSPETEFTKGHIPYHKGKKRPGVGGNPNWKKGMIAWNKGIDMPFVSGSKNSKWLGDKVGYSALHDWVRKVLGKPFVCEKCSSSIRVEWANKSYKWLRKKDDWISLCHSCHFKLDRKNGWGKKKLVFNGEKRLQIFPIQ